MRRPLVPLFVGLGVLGALTGCSGGSTTGASTRGAPTTGASGTGSTTATAGPLYIVPVSESRPAGHLMVTPGRTVVAGTTLTVSSVGPCPSGGIFDVFVQLTLVQLPYHPSPTSYAAGASSGSLGTTGGEWSATLTVPSNTFPGRYELYAVCSDYAPGFLAEYRGLPITVSAVGCRRPEPGIDSYEDRPCEPP